MNLYETSVVGSFNGFGPGASGRRLRILARLLGHSGGTVFYSIDGQHRTDLLKTESPISYGAVQRLLLAKASPELEAGYECLSSLKYRQQPHKDEELVLFLEDLADDFIWDVHDACAAFDNPKLFYPGIDPPLIEPVSDAHVAVVIIALQRELDRERRPPKMDYADLYNSGVGYYGFNGYADSYYEDGYGGYLVPDRLPAAPLAELPFRIQRALVERRRYRFLQFGIDQQAFETGLLSLWAIPEDPDWVPRRTNIT